MPSMTTTARPWQSSGGAQHVRVQHVRAQHVAMTTQQFAKPRVVQVHANAPFATRPAQQIQGFGQTAMVNVASMTHAGKSGVEVLEPCDFAAAKPAEDLEDLHLKPVELEDMYIV